MNAIRPPSGSSNNPRSAAGRPFGGPVIVMLVLAGIAIITMLAREQAALPGMISYDEFVREVKAGHVATVQISGNILTGEYRGTAGAAPSSAIGAAPKTFRTELSSYLGRGLDDLLLANDVKTIVRQPTDGTGFLIGLYMLGFLVLMGLMWTMLRRARDPLGGTGFLGGFSRSPAKRYSPADKQVTFADVAGLEQVKADLQEIVEFLKDPQKFQRLGGRVPKGVLLMGPPGTGKTLLALAAALECRQKYRQILLARPVVPLSNRDLGFLPGDVGEKLDPYMQPLYDNLTVIRHQCGDNTQAAQRVVEMRESEKLQITPLAYIRGRSLQRIFFIVDEAQNLTPHEIKTIITRAGEGTKIVFTGDVCQIDQPYLDALSNGLSTLIHRMVGQPIYAHVTLEKGERSELADLASAIL